MDDDLEPPSWMDDGPPPDPPASAAGRITLLAWLSRSGRSQQSWRIRPSTGQDVAFCDIVACRRALDAGVSEAELLAELPNRVSDRPIGFDPRVAVAAAADLIRADTVAQRRPTEITPTIALVAILADRPRRYVWRLDGSTTDYECGSLDVTGPTAFRRWSLGYLPTMPTVPSTREFAQWMDAQIAAAEVREVPEDMTEDGMVCDMVEEATRLLTLGESYDDLRNGKAVEHDAHKAISAPAFLHHQLRQTLPTVTITQLYMALRQLGWTPAGAVRIGAHTAKCWLSPDTIARATSTAKERIAMSGAKRRMALVTPLIDSDDRGFFDEVGGSHD